MHYGNPSVSKCNHGTKKWSFPLRISSVISSETADLVTFSEETLNGKLFFCCEYSQCQNEGPLGTGHH